MGAPPEEPETAADGTAGGQATVIDGPRHRGEPREPPPPLPAEDAPIASRPVEEIDPEPPTGKPDSPTSATITTAVEAMRNEEVHRTRVFIRLGWVASIAGFFALPVVHGDPTVRVAMVGALLVGIVVSFYYHQRFAVPENYGPSALRVLGLMCVINTHVVVLFFGAFTATPVFLVIGLHFVGRSELSPRFAVYVSSAICHGLIALALIAGVRDPGVFATARPLGTEAYIIGALFVQGMYVLAYYTGVRQRHVSLRAIEQMQRATRVASQRAALLDELRADLARAQQGGAGRYSDQQLGAFRLGTVLGRGAHGEVYEGTALGSGEPVAVKVLHRDQLVDATAVARFLREARATGSIGSSHVVKVIAASEPNASVPFIAMERLRGATLADLLRRKGQLTRAELIALITQVGEGLDAVHAAGVVHRDLKPQNLFLDGLTWKILDFGVATLGDHGGTLTKGAIVGTPQYMAPEQAKGETVDFRADLYALAAVAYRALTGRNAFGGSDTPAVLYAVVHKMPARPSALIDVVEDVDRWTALALAKDPARRPASGKLLAGQLVAALRGELAQPLRDAAERLIGGAPWQEAS